MQNYLSFYLTNYANSVAWRILVSVIGYSVRPLIITHFAVLFAPSGKHIFAWCLVGINTVMHATAFFSKIVFTITSNNSYCGGPLKYLCLAVCFVLLAYLAILSFMSYKEKKISAKEISFHIFWLAIIVVGIVSDILWAYDYIWISYVTISVVITEIFSYIWLHQRFVADYESAVLAEQRYKTLISQLQPHFIYNSLSAIAEIEGVPQTAQKAIVDFSDYLRENLDAMTSEELVTFDKELEYIEKYIALETLRFGDKVRVVYDMECADFCLPALSVQMLVENAVKHGITKKYEGDPVAINAYKGEFMMQYDWAIL